MMKNPPQFCVSVLLVFAAVVVAGDSVEGGKKYALFVGVESYNPSQLAQLRFAEDDALALAESLTNLGFDVVTIYLFRRDSQFSLATS